jgi:hypothetical protein
MNQNTTNPQPHAGDVCPNPHNKEAVWKKCPNAHCVAGHIFDDDSQSWENCPTCNGNGSVRHLPGKKLEEGEVSLLAAADADGKISWEKLDQLRAHVQPASSASAGLVWEIQRRYGGDLFAQGAIFQYFINAKNVLYITKDGFEVSSDFSNDGIAARETSKDAAEQHNAFIAGALREKEEEVKQAYRDGYARCAEVTQKMFDDAKSELAKLRTLAREFIETCQVIDHGTDYPSWRTWDSNKKDALAQTAGITGDEK